jgi:hypothetical protein
MAFIRKMTLGRAGHAWLDVQQSFEDAWDESPRMAQATARILDSTCAVERGRVVVPIARKHLLPDPLFFRCIFSGAVSSGRGQAAAV